MMGADLTRSASYLSPPSPSTMFLFYFIIPIYMSQGLYGSISNKSSFQRSVYSMDVGVVSLLFKDQKLDENKSIDIISNLPDHVLHYIISFLSTRDAIRSSVLSKRWKHLWTSIPNIDLEDHYNWKMVFNKRQGIRYRQLCREFGEEYIEPNSYFLEFVGRVVTLHDASDIKRLRLRLSVPETYPDLNLWLQVAINHNVEELDLTLREKVQNALSCCLFTCHSLVVLRIHADIILNPPPSTFFTKLKKLSLQRVTFSDDLSSQHLFSGCPVLEELVLIRCNLKLIDNFTISIPTLKSLIIEHVYGYNLIEVYSINLTDLEFSNICEVNICMGELPALSCASLWIRDPIEPIDVGLATRARKLFSEISNIKVMKFTYQVLLYIICVSKILVYIPTFYKLVHLEVSRVEYPCYNDLMKFLMKIPNLEHLYLHQVRYEDEACEMVEMVPSCFNSSLKIFTIDCFSGTQAEMELISFILRNASVLQRVIIYFSKILPKFKESVVFRTVRPLTGRFGSDEPISGKRSDLISEFSDRSGQWANSTSPYADSIAAGS